MTRVIISEINVKPCANGVKCKLNIFGDEIVVFGSDGEALGYFTMADLAEAYARVHIKEGDS